MTAVIFRAHHAGWNVRTSWQDDKVWLDTRILTDTTA
jgi:hypothetical protein